MSWELAKKVIGCFIAAWLITFFVYIVVVSVT